MAKVGSGERFEPNAREGGGGGAPVTIVDESQQKLRMNAAGVHRPKAVSHGVRLWNCCRQEILGRDPDGGRNRRHVVRAHVAEERMPDVRVVKRAERWQSLLRFPRRAIGAVASGTTGGERIRKDESRACPLRRLDPKHA